MRYAAFLLLIPIALLSACNASTEMDIASADSTSLANSIASINSPSRKIIHTADITCRVKNVYTATQQIEDLVNALDGRVTDSRMSNEVINSNTLHYKEDSQKIVQEYRGTAHLTLRVPAMLKDSVMKLLPSLAEFTDTRMLKQTDVTLAYLSNAMKNEAAGVAPPVVVDQENGGLKENTEETHIATGKADTVTDRRIDNLQMLDDVNYATIRVELYQPAGTDVQIVADPGYAARIPFGIRISVALNDGLELLKPMVIFLVRMWPLWMICFGIWSLYGWLKKRKVLRPVAKY